jgi:hypothetical protein
MNKLREKIFAWLQKRQAARQIVMPQWDHIRSVVILYHNDNIQHIIKQIQAQDKDVVLFTMPDKKDVCWLTERPKTDIIESITARKFDILIDLTQEPSRTLQYMAMYIRADFKVGRFIREGIHDLTIDTPPQAAPDYLLEQILRYIDMFGIK